MAVLALMDEDELELTRGARRRRTAAIALIALAMIVVGGVATWLATRPAPACDDRQVRTIIESQEIPASAFHEVCALPPALASTLRVIEQSPPNLEALLAMKVAADAPELVLPRCATAPGALAAAISAAPGQKVQVFLQGCPALHAPFASREALERAPLHRVVLALAMFTALHGREPRAEAIARRMLQIP